MALMKLTTTAALYGVHAVAWCASRVLVHCGALVRRYADHVIVGYTPAELAKELRRG